MKTLSELQTVLAEAEKRLKVLEEKQHKVELPYNTDIYSKYDKLINFEKGFIAGTKDAIKEAKND